MKIGQAIEKRRNELHLTLEDVGNAIGVGKSTVKKWETGFIKNMKRDKIYALAKVLRINPASFIYGDDDDVDYYEFTASTGSDLSNHEKTVITAYRAMPAMQPAVDRILGVAEDAEGIITYRAARSADNHPAEWCRERDLSELPTASDEDIDGGEK